MELEFVIDEQFAKTRVDVFCVEKTGFTRNKVQKNIEDENILVNDKKVKANYKLRNNDNVKVIIQEPVEVEIKPTKMNLNILYEDKDIIVVNKDKGVVVHPANGHYDDTLVNGLMYHTKDLSGINGEIRPGIVHRIDKDTSGVLVVAKNDVAHNKLSNQLKDHTMTRVYYAVVVNNVKNDEGTIDKPIGRHKTDRKKMAIREDGRNAVTHYKVIERLKGATLIECRLETGRTHQIRVHLASIGHYLLGDTLYGSSIDKNKLNGQALHAKTLGFIHPTTDEYIEFDTEVPEYFQNLVKKLGGNTVE